MSILDDYNAAKKKRKQESGVAVEAAVESDGSILGDYQAAKAKRESDISLGDIGPLYSRLDIAPTVKTKKEDDERKWFQKGAFEDGYQFGDITKTILGTATDVAENVGSGILGLGEKLVDTVAYFGVQPTTSRFNTKLESSSEVAKRAENYRNTMERITTDFIKKDLYDEEAIAKKIISDPVEFLTGVSAEDDSVLGEKTDSLAQSGGQLLATAGLQAVGVPWFVTAGVSSFGSEVENALNEDATYGEAGVSAAISAGAEILTEKISGGIKFGGKTLDDGLTKQIARGVSNKVVRTLTKLGVDMAGEGAEEILSGVIGAVGQKITYEDDKKLTELFTAEDAWESFIGGAVLGGTSSGFQAVNSARKGVDYTTGLTENEQAVVDKVYKDMVAEAEKEGKVTQKEKSKIYDEVLDQLDKGYISTETIEEVLGGEQFTQYNDTVKYEDSLLNEYNELGKKQNATLEEQTRYQKLGSQVEEMQNNSQRKQLKSKLSESVFELVKGDRLSESYNEKARRTQKFEADLTKYDAKQQQTIQKAIDSGVLNNTRRTHEFVDIVAKISADKGVLFDFTNNQKLKESGFAVDGKTVNGYVTKDGITINTQSAKYINSIVGHEITHVLEGTEVYNELKNTLFEYAKSKGDYQGRFDSLSELYKDIKGADIEAELTADLVGDYLFTDKDFIKNLSVKNRNLFEKIYDEIKYLLKVVTGTKEEKKLAKVQKAFEEAYRAKGKSSGTKYSLGETTDGRYVAIVDSDILSNIDTTTWDKAKKEEARKAASDALKNFKDGIVVDGITRKVNKTSRREYTRSDYTDSLYNYAPDVFADKMRAAEVADDIVVAATNWNRDGGLVHPRKDNFVDFDHGRTLIVSGNAKYDAEVVVGITAKGEAVFYDVVDMKPTTFDVKKAESPPTATTQNAIGDIQGDSTSGGIVAQNGKNVNYSLSDSTGKELSKGQQEYFKDSKVRDKNGNLKVMYHGSQDAGFHVFDGKYSDDDISFFFVDRNDVAASYSGTTETYEAKTIKSAEDMNNFLAEIGYDQYEAVERNGKFELLEDGEHVATSDTAQGIYKEFCWYEGVGEGDANYKVYLNLKNPLVVDAQGRNWNNISREYSQEVYDRYKSLTDSEKTALADIADWGEYSIFRTEILEMAKAKGNGKYHDADLASAYEKLGGANANLYDAFTIASDNFSEDTLREFAVKQMNTRDYAQRAKEQGYDGVIFNNIVDNGGYSNGSEGASTVAIAFEPNQIKSTANVNPTEDADIRYSVSEAQNQQGLDTQSEVQFSLAHDTAYMDNAISQNNSMNYVESEVMTAAKGIRQRIADRMNAIKDRGLVGLPEDMEGNTAIANSSYDVTEENTTICPRSLAAEAFVDAVSEYLGRPLTVEEQIYISQDLQGRSLTPECTYCYVATDRKAYRAFLGEYINQRDSVIKKIAENPGADVSRSGELYKEFLNGRKDTNPMYSRFKMWVDAYRNGTPMVDASHLANMNRLMGDLKEFGEALRPQIVDAMKYAQSASWAKKRINYVAYNGHILNWKQDRINKLNSHYGLRMYSFSDFHPAFVLENMQMITDASVRGLKMLGYTKDIDFVDIFAPTGMNINVSTFGFESGGNVYENNIIGAEWQKAKDLRAKYPNVGVTFVATNDTLVDWALQQDWIDVVIPYHLVRTGAEVAKAFNYTNYTSESADTKDTGWTKGKDKKYIAPTEHNNDKATYLEALKKNHLKPRFERFIDNPNYMKLVNECRQSASESKPVQPKFNEDAAMVALAKLEANGYYQPIGGSVDRMYEIAGEVAENMNQELAPAMSLSEMGEQAKQYGRYNVSGEDIMLQESVPEVAPAPEATQAEVDEMFPNDLAPIQSELSRLMEEKSTLEDTLYRMANNEEFGDEFNRISQQWNEVNQRIQTLEGELETSESGRIDSLDDTNVPPEMDAPYSGPNDVTVDDPFADREWYDIGNKKVKAYMYENPEVKPFFQEEALKLMGELNDTTRGERWYNDQLYYESGGEKGFGGTKRHTSQTMETLLDAWHMSYADIEKGLNAIIEDNGAENIAAAKKLEFMLNERLLNGYKDFYTNQMVEPNQDYINLLNEKQINNYSKESFDAFMQSADQYAPEDIAPVNPNNNQNYYDYNSKRDVIGQQSVFPVKDATVNPKQQTIPGVETSKVAKVLTEEPQAEKKNNLWSKFKNTVLDKGMVFEDLSLATGNRELQARWNSIRYAEAKAQKVIGDGNAFTRSLDSIKSRVDKTGKTQQFYEYLYHKHNIDRMTLEERFEDGKNKPVFGDAVTADLSRNTVEKLERANPEFKQFAQEVYDYMNHLRDLLVDAGVISNETAKLWATMYPNYVPIRRAGDTGVNINVPLDTNRTGVNAPIKRATGGNSDILPLFDTMGQRTIQTYRAIAKNRFGVELKNTLGTVIAKDSVDVDETVNNIDNHEGLLQEGKNGQKPTFTVFENGERVTFEITEEMYDAMKPSGWNQNSKTLNKISEFRRATLTEYNPWFMLKNAVKDIQDVFINSQHSLKTYASVPKAIKQMTEKGHYYQEYIDNGGQQNSYFDSVTNEFKKETEIPVLKQISKANNIVETIPRLAEYIASREMGRSIDVSMLDAARVTTNFAAGGDFTKMLNRNGATFLNASVQGAVQQVRNFREAKMNGLKGWAGLAGKFIAAGLPVILLNHLMWDDDEEYEEVPDYVKQNYYIVGKFADGKFVRIPKGRTVAVIQEAFNQMDNLITGDDDVDMKSFMELVVSNLAPNNPLDNNIFSPIAQTLSNTTWYGEDLVPTRLQDLPAGEQYDESTDAISKWLGETTNTSPYKWNYLLDQYSGVLGDTFLPMLTPEAESGDNSFLGNMIAPLKDMFTTDSVMNNQNVSEFYDLKDELTITANGSNATDEDKLRSKYINSISSSMSELYQQKREIQNSDLADDEKYAQVRDIQKQIIDMMKEGMSNYQDISYEGEYARVGDRLYKKNDEGEWSKLSDEQVLKYEVTSAAGDAPYATDGTNHYRFYVKEGETDGEWRKITDEQLEKQEEVTSGLDITPEEYWGNKEEYDYAYENPESYAVAKAVGGYESYRKYSSDLYDIKSDKDEYGKSISGSRKEKVLDYINNLDADYYTKLILFKSEYTSYDDENMEIINYLNDRDDISYKEMESILLKLGFYVDSKGNISWD